MGYSRCSVTPLQSQILHLPVKSLNKQCGIFERGDLIWGKSRGNMMDACAPLSWQGLCLWLCVPAIHITNFLTGAQRRVALSV